MLLFRLLLILFSLNVIQSELYESKPGELSEAASNVQEYSVSLDDLGNSNIKNNIIKRDVPGVDEREYLASRSMSFQSGKRRHLSPVPSRARRLPQPGAQRRGRKNRRSRRRGRSGRRGRSPVRIDRSGSGFSGRGKRARGGSQRQNQSPQGDNGFEEIECEGEILEVGPEVVSEDC
uniref:FoP_duplication domain-containing protein n=1 Tax=Strongyloides papillosus TaxID=174720 RepID=A0A0N5C5H1_STREA